MEIIINKDKILKIEDKMNLVDFLELADMLMPFSKVAVTEAKAEVSTPRLIGRPPAEKSKWYIDGKESGKIKSVKSNPYHKPKTKRKMRHKWLNREHALQAIKLHYLGTGEQKEAFTIQEGMSWVELSKSFSGLIKRFKIKPGEIGLSHFKRDRITSLINSPYDNNLKRKEKKNGNGSKSDETDIMKQVYNLRQSEMDFSEIKKKLGISNNKARRLYRKYYNKMYHKEHPNGEIQVVEIADKEQDNINKDEHPNIKIAEQHLIKFFSEIDRHTPEQIEQTIILLSNFLKNVKTRKGDKEDILDFLNQHFPNQLTPIVNPDDIDNWLLK